MSKPVKTKKTIDPKGKPVKVAKADKPSKTDQTKLKGNLKKLGYDDATLATIVIDGDDLGTMTSRLIAIQRNAPKA